MSIAFRMHCVGMKHREIACVCACVENLRQKSNNDPFVCYDNKRAKIKRSVNDLAFKDR